MRARTVRLPWVVAAGLLVCAVAGACGGGGDSDAPEPGTVSLRNETDQGMAPQTVVAFFMEAAGGTDPGPNRLPEPVLPGGVVIVGLFAPGAYDAVAVLDGGVSITWLDLTVTASQPTDLTVPAP